MTATISTQPTAVLDRWPALPYEAWKETLTTLHMWTQVVGKVKLELAPFLNHWWQVALTVTPRGLTSSTIPYGRRAFQVDFDFIDHRLDIEVSDGTRRSLSLAPRSVAGFYEAFLATLKELGIEVRINRTPAEVAHPIPFEQDHQHASYDADAVTRWWGVLLQVDRLLRRFRTTFVGKSSPVLFWWGSFDLSAKRYSGRSTPPREYPARWMAIGNSAEYSEAGFWPGGDQFPEPAFFAYTYPEPPGCDEAAINPEPAAYHAALREFVLPYERVRTAGNPEQMVMQFFQSTYQVGADLAGWDRAALERPDPFASRQAEASI